MEREGREGGDGTAEDAGEDYGLAGGQHTEECIWRGHGAGMAGEKAINKTVKTQSLLDNYSVFIVSLVLNGVVITQSLLHEGELCEGTTGGNEGRAGPGE